ncbi:fungal-specific transcription factor domain-containing protein [Xylaria venustula]|nr:fungal-specific transcription factor domain-containing protein [Xylaria venustula]
MAEELEIDISNQENVSQRTNTIRRSSKQNIRHRASVACYSCRDRRIRCVVPKGASACTQCKRSGTECVIKMDDERRRPISKAYVSSLSARIELLESMLEDKGVFIPPAIHPPATKNETQSASSGDDIRIPNLESRRRSSSDASQTSRHILSPPYSHEDLSMTHHVVEDPVNIDTPRLGKETIQKEYPSLKKPNLKQEDIMYQLLCPNGGLLYDQLPRTPGLFDHSADHNTYANTHRTYETRESPEQIRRAERIIRSLTPKTYDYLMQNFWRHQNSVFQVVDRADFEADRGSEAPKFYSSFLHVIMLALGWQFANKDSCDVARTNLGNHESSMHREAKSMLDMDLERPMGVSSVQSLLLLGDLEYGVGRENTGWMYIGMANRLALDMGLNVNCSNSRLLELPDQEIRVRRRVMKACVVYETYWALFLGRRANIERGEIDFNASETTSPSHPYRHGTGTPTDTRSSEEEINDQLFELMRLASRIMESRTRLSRSRNPTASFTTETAKHTSTDVSILDQQLQDWYQRLPNHLIWSPKNIRNAPFSYFLLHEQYQAVVILLHSSLEAQGLAYNNEPTSLPPSSPHNQTNNSTKSVPSACIEAAIQFAQIVSQSREKCDVGKRFCASLQPTRVAAVTLLAAIELSKDDADRRVYLSSLQVLLDAVRVMSLSYQPATRLGSLIQAGLARLRLGFSSSQIGNDNHWEKDTNHLYNDSKAQSKGTNMFSSFKSNRELYDSDQFLTDNGRSSTIRPQTSFEYTRPRLPSHALPSPTSSQYPNGDHSNIPNLGPIFPGSPESSMNVDSLYSIGTKSIYSNNSILPIRYGSDNFLRVAPSSKVWGLHSLHAASELKQPGQDIDSQMPDWVGESVTALSVPQFDNSNAALSTGLDSNFDTKSLSGYKREDSASLGWVNSERGTNALTPISLKDSVQNSDKEHANSDVAAPPRNYELDFLSL